MTFGKEPAAVAETSSVLSSLSLTHATTTIATPTFSILPDGASITSTEVSSATETKTKSGKGGKTQDSTSSIIVETSAAAVATDSTESTLATKSRTGKTTLTTSTSNRAGVAASTGATRTSSARGTGNRGGTAAATGGNAGSANGTKTGTGLPTIFPGGAGRATPMEWWSRSAGSAMSGLAVVALMVVGGTMVV